MSKCVATSTSFSDADLLALFDDAGSDEAGTELLDHFKTRQSPRWYFDMRNGSLAETPFAWPHRPDLNPETVVDLAADLLKGRVRNEYPPPRWRRPRYRHQAALAARSPER